MSLAGYPKGHRPYERAGQATHDTANTVARHSAFSCSMRSGRWQLLYASAQRTIFKRGSHP